MVLGMWRILPFLVVTEGKLPSLAEKTAVQFLSISIDEPSEKENVATFSNSSLPHSVISCLISLPSTRHIRYDHSHGDPVVAIV